MLNSSGNFLEQELLSTLGKKYRTSDYQILTGHSFAGLFTSYVAMTPNSQFDAVISISPSLWWDSDWLVLKSAELLPAKRAKPLRWFFEYGKWTQWNGERVCGAN